MGVTRRLPLPVGVVTLLFSDIEGSTRLVHVLGDAFERVLADHNRPAPGSMAAPRGCRGALRGRRVLCGLSRGGSGGVGGGRGPMRAARTCGRAAGSELSLDEAIGYAQR